MRTIFYEHNKILDIGNGFTAIMHLYKTTEGTVLKTYIYRGVHSDDEVLVSSLLSSSNDESYLFSSAYKTLYDKEHLERIWQSHINRKKQD